MDILENDLEDIIFNMFKEDSDLISDINCEKGIILRQPTLSVYGKMDLVNISFENYNYEYQPEFIDENLAINPAGRKKVRNWGISIIELKRGKIGYNELGQICRYKTGLERFIKSQKYKKDKFTIRGILIGKEIEQNGDFTFLLNHLNDISTFIYKLDYKTGLNFEEQTGWFIRGEDFSKISISVDKKEVSNLLKEWLTQIMRGVEI